MDKSKSTDKKTTTWYEVTIAYFRGDGQPGWYTQKRLISKKMFGQLAEQFRAKVKVDGFLTDDVYQEDENTSVEALTLWTPNSKFFFIEIAKVTRKEGLIIVSNDDRFNMANFHHAEGYKGNINDPEPIINH